VPYTLILHIQNSDPVVGEVDVLPTPADNLVIVHNPRRLDGKDVTYLADNVVTVYWPMDRLNFIEVLAGKEEEDIIGFVRE
jgi:predicted nucleotidyltransferase